MGSPFPNKVAAVFDCVELCEMILEMTSTKDVAVVHRVCRPWKNTIDGSPKLQMLLFRRPDNTRRELRYAKKGEYTVWQYAQKHYRGVIMGDPEFPQGLWPSTIITLHPMLDGETYGGPTYGGPGHRGGFFFDLCKVYDRVYGPALDMLISQPPLERLVLRPGYSDSVTVIGPQGITFRDLFETMQAVRMRGSFASKHRTWTDTKRPVICDGPDAKAIHAIFDGRIADSNTWVRDAYARLSMLENPRRRDAMPEKLEFEPDTL